MQQIADTAKPKVSRSTAQTILAALVADDLASRHEVDTGRGRAFRSSKGNL